MGQHSDGTCIGKYRFWFLPDSISAETLPVLSSPVFKTVLYFNKIINILTDTRANSLLEPKPTEVY